jgi:ferric-chelate reductase
MCFFILPRLHSAGRRVARHIICLSLSLSSCTDINYSFEQYVWPCFIIIGVDRILRGIRIAFNHRGTTAKIEAFGSEMVRVTVKRRMDWTPGQHAYLMMPAISRLPTETHPFSICTVPEPVDGSISRYKKVQFIMRARGGFTKRLREAALNGVSQTSCYIDGPYGSPPNLKEFTTCVLVAGGSGASYTLPLLMDLVK